MARRPREIGEWNPKRWHPACNHTNKRYPCFVVRDIPDCATATLEDRYLITPKRCIRRFSTYGKASDAALQAMDKEGRSAIAERVKNRLRYFLEAINKAREVLYVS